FDPRRLAEVNQSDVAGRTAEYEGQKTRRLDAGADALRRVAEVEHVAADELDQGRPLRQRRCHRPVVRLPQLLLQADPGDAAGQFRLDAFTLRLPPCELLPVGL